MDPEKIKTDLVSYFGPSSSFSYFKDMRSPLSGLNYLRNYYVYKPSWPISYYKMYSYFGNQEGPTLNQDNSLVESFAYSEGVDDSNPQYAPYHAIIEAKSPQYIASFDGNITNDSTYQLFSDEVPYYNITRRVFKEYRLYQQHGFFKMKITHILAISQSIIQQLDFI